MIEVHPSVSPIAQVPSPQVTAGLSDLFGYLVSVAKTTPSVASEILRQVQLLSSEHEHGIQDIFSMLLTEFSSVFFANQDVGITQSVLLTDGDLFVTDSEVLHSKVFIENEELPIGYTERGMAIAEAIHQKFEKLLGAYSHHNYTADMRGISKPKNLKQYIHDLVTLVAQVSITGIGSDGQVEPTHRHRCLHEGLALRENSSKNDYPIEVYGGVPIGLNQAVNTDEKRDQFQHEVIDRVIQGLANTLSNDTCEEIFTESLAHQHRAYSPYRSFATQGEGVKKSLMAEPHGSFASQDFQNSMLFLSLSRDINFHIANDGSFLLSEEELNSLYNGLSKQYIKKKDFLGYYHLSYKDISPLLHDQLAPAAVQNLLFEGFLRYRAYNATMRADSNNIMIPGKLGIKQPQAMFTAEFQNGSYCIHESAYYSIVQGNRKYEIPSFLIKALSQGFITIDDIFEILSSGSFNGETEKKIDSFLFGQISSIPEFRRMKSHDGQSKIVDCLRSQLGEVVHEFYAGEGSKSRICTQSVNICITDSGNDTQENGIMNARSISKQDHRSLRHLDLQFFTDLNGFIRDMQITSIENHQESDANTASIMLRQIFAGLKKDEPILKPQRKPPKAIQFDGYIAYSIDAPDDSLYVRDNKKVSLAQNEVSKPRHLLARQFRPLLALSVMLRQRIISNAIVSQAVMTDAVCMGLTNLSDQTALTPDILARNFGLTQDAVQEILKVLQLKNQPITLSELLILISETDNRKPILTPKTSLELVSLFLSILDTQVLVTRVGESLTQYSTNLGYQGRTIVANIDTTNEKADRALYAWGHSISEYKPEMVEDNVEARLLCSTTRESFSDDIVIGIGIDSTGQMNIRLNIPDITNPKSKEAEILKVIEWFGIEDIAENSYDVNNNEHLRELQKIMYHQQLHGYEGGFVGFEPEFIQTEKALLNGWFNRK